MKFGIASVFVRWLFALGLMFALYNPTGRCFLAWAARSDDPLAIKFAVGVAIFTAFYILAGATLRTGGYPGVFLLLVLLVALGGAIVELGFVDASDGTQLTLLVQALIATGLGIGLCWSAIRARLSGQVDSDDVSRRY